MLVELLVNFNYLSVSKPLTTNSPSLMPDPIVHQTVCTQLCCILYNKIFYSCLDYIYFITYIPISLPIYLSTYFLFI